MKCQIRLYICSIEYLQITKSFIDEQFFFWISKNEYDRQHAHFNVFV